MSLDDQFKSDADMIQVPVQSVSTTSHVREYWCYHWPNNRWLDQ